MGKMQSKFSQTIFLLLDQKSKQQQINEDLRQQISEQQEKIKLLKEQVSRHKGLQKRKRLRLKGDLKLLMREINYHKR